MALQHYYGDIMESEALRGTEAENTPHKSILDLLDGFYDQFRTEKGDNYNVEQHRALVKGMFEGYTIIYRPDEFESFEPEVAFKISVPNPLLTEKEFVLAGKTDGRIKQNNKPYLFETKTTSENSITRYIEQLALAEQSCNYLHGFNSMGIDAVGVIYNIVRKCNLRQGKNESDEKFFARIRQAYIDDANKDRKYYHREVIYKTPAELEQHLKELREVTKDMSAYYPYRSPARCGDYGSCEFKRLCEGGDMGLDFVEKTRIHEELSEEMGGAC